MQALAFAVDDWPSAEPAPQLSTDYLNRYGEALMLLEMAPMDPEIVDDLKAWSPVGYRDHFEASQLRCAASALAAYAALASDRRQAFDQVCSAMNRLIATVTALLDERGCDQDSSTIVAVAGEALRVLIGRATLFINANGQVDVEAVATPGLQDEIDALFAN
jgi:hypothetical protein